MYKQNLASARFANLTTLKHGKVPLIEANNLFIREMTQKLTPLLSRQVLITAEEKRQGNRGVTFQILILLERRNSGQCATNGRHNRRLQERNGILK